MAGAEQFLAHHRRLTRLIHDAAFLQQSRQAKLAELAAFCAQTLAVDRVSVWRMQGKHDFMACEYLHRAPAESSYQPTGLPVLEKKRYPRYFTALTDTGLIIAEQAQTDAQLSEFGPEFLSRLDIGSLLQMPIYGNQGLEGMVAVASAAPGRQWRPNDIALASAVAETISLTNFRDDWQASQQLLEYMALHDSVTHLPNKNALINHLQLRAAEARPNEHHVLLWLDIDRFKSVTEVLGENGLNQVVSLVAMRLQACCTLPGEIVARLSKDEFAVVLQTEPTNNAKDGGRIAALHRALNVPYEVNDRTLNLTTSIGAAEYQGQSVKLWMRQAESAMLEAKSSGGDCTTFFTDRLQGERDRRISLETELRHALETGELCMHYQPVMDAVTGQVVCAEALIRWQHPERGLISPGEFLPLAARAGLMTRLDAYVLRRVCADLNSLHDQELTCRIAINLSGQQLGDSQFPKDIQATLQEYGIKGDCLEIEVTEHATKGDAFAVATTLQRISELGIRLAIDDFGTGYSSLSRLKYMPFNKLKIDRSFVADLPHDQDVCSMVKAIDGLANGLSLEVVAEGVETQAQQEWLTAQGIEGLQGFLLSRPMPFPEFAVYLQSRPEAQAVV